MWTSILGVFTSVMTLFYAFLAFAVPFAVYSFNQVLRKHGDPPWKKDLHSEDDLG